MKLIKLHKNPSRLEDKLRKDLLESQFESISSLSKIKGENSTEGLVGKNLKVNFKFHILCLKYREKEHYKNKCPNFKKSFHTTYIIIKDLKREAYHMLQVNIRIRVC